MAALLHAATPTETLFPTPMKTFARTCLWFVMLALMLTGWKAVAADHNDPNAINSIFADVKPDPADLYDIYGWPSSDTHGGDKVIIALTFASMPATGVFDTDLLYRIKLAPTPRLAPPLQGDHSLSALLGFFDAVKARYGKLHPAEVRVVVSNDGRGGQSAKIDFLRFMGGCFTRTVKTNQTQTVTSLDGKEIKVFVGGRDDAFFNDLPGFFRSINYAPQFYHVPMATTDRREMPIPKTLIELEGNTLFNFDPAHPLHGQGEKYDMPSGPGTWNGKAYHKDANGNFRFVYSGRDAQAGKDINTIIVEIPLECLTEAPEKDRVVNAWGESWVRKAADKAKDKVPAIPDDRTVPAPFWLRFRWIIALFLLVGGIWVIRHQRLKRKTDPEPVKHYRWKIAGGAALVVASFVFAGLTAYLNITKPELGEAEARADKVLSGYKLVDTDGQPFADAALNERENDRQLGANNFWLGPHFVTRLAHLGWGFGPSITALGLPTSFDHGNAPLPIHKVYSAAGIGDAFLRARKVIFQELNMPDDTWNPKKLNIPLKRSFEIFIPNVCPIDMDTTGTWPYGRRPEDQVATRFLSLFLDMSGKAGGKQINIETLSDQALWDSVKIEPKTPPNPLHNDKPFLDKFPYLADPWHAVPEK